MDTCVVGILLRTEGDVKKPFRCMWCEELVASGDLTHSLLPGYHYACALRASLGPIGHLQGTCTCYVKDGTHEDDPPGLTKRQAARIVADFVNQQQQPQSGRN